MKLIFLDIDGVLNCRATYEKARKTFDFSDPTMSRELYYKSLIDPSMLGLLNGLVERSGAEIVLSSTWRRMFSNDFPGSFQTFMDELGLKGTIRGMTPLNLIESFFKISREDGDKYFTQKRRHGVFEQQYTRGHEIMFSLLRQKEDVESFVILDDIEEMDYLDPWLVRTSPKIGLTEEDVEKATELLNNTEWEIDPSTSDW